VGKNKLDTNIKLLGVIPYHDVYRLIKFAKAVINPSLFEGWSSSVEECKSVGKSLILSNIEVHKEQSVDASFFEKTNPDSLAATIQSFENYDSVEIPEDVESRTKDYACNYIEIIKSVLNS
jgi:glycosyltransferase involved in cell wall biosynthesis